MWWVLMPSWYLTEVHSRAAERRLWRHFRRICLVHGTPRSPLDAERNRIWRYHGNQAFYPLFRVFFVFSINAHNLSDEYHCAWSMVWSYHIKSLKTGAVYSQVDFAWHRRLAVEFETTSDCNLDLLQLDFNWVKSVHNSNVGESSITITKPIHRNICVPTVIWCMWTYCVDCSFLNLHSLQSSGTIVGWAWNIVNIISCTDYGIFRHEFLITKHVRACRHGILGPGPHAKESRGALSLPLWSPLPSLRSRPHKYS